MNSFNNARMARLITDIILDKAAELFADKGYDCTPISEIASHVGVSNGTIMYHFKRKELILAEIALRYLRGLHYYVEERMDNAESGVDSVLVYVAAYYDFLDKNQHDSACYFKNLPFERLKGEKDLVKKIELAQAKHNIFRNGLLHCLATDRIISADQVPVLSRSIQSVMLGGAIMIHFLNNEALSVKNDSIFSVRGMLSLGSK